MMVMMAQSVSGLRETRRNRSGAVVSTLSRHEGEVL
jgi:hypothetical protein